MGWTGLARQPRAGNIGAEASAVNLSIGKLGHRAEAAKAGGNMFIMYVCMYVCMCMCARGVDDGGGDGQQQQQQQGLLLRVSMYEEEEGERAGEQTLRLRGERE